MEKQLSSGAKAFGADMIRAAWNYDRFHRLKHRFICPDKNVKIDVSDFPDIKTGALTGAFISPESKMVNDESKDRISEQYEISILKNGNREKKTVWLATDWNFQKMPNTTGSQSKKTGSRRLCDALVRVINADYGEVFQIRGGDFSMIDLNYSTDKRLMASIPRHD